MITDTGVLYSTQLGDFKVNTAFHPPLVDKINTRDMWGVGS